MRATALVIFVAALVCIAAAEEPEKYAVWGAAGVVYDKNELMKHGTWVTGDVIYDKNEGLLFRAYKAVQEIPLITSSTSPYPRIWRRALGLCATAQQRTVSNYGYARHSCRILLRPTRDIQT